MTSPVARVVASYHDLPCAYVRPDDAPVRPGQPCGQVHEHCRGHVRTKTAATYGDPCSKNAEEGTLVCPHHGHQLPAVANATRTAKAHRAYGRLVGHVSAPVDDPVAEFARVLGAMRDWSDGLLELAADIQTGNDPLTIVAGGEFSTIDAGDGNHPAVTGNLLVLDPAGHYKLHPVIVEARAAMEAYAKATADAVKLGIEERRVTLEGKQFDLTVAALRVMFERLGMDPEDAMPMFAVAARDVEAIDTTITQTVAGHVRRGLGS